MAPKSAIVIVVDRLGAGFVGPYGNTWIETPTLNQFASESTLWENAIATCPDLDAFYRSVAVGKHPKADRDRSLESLVEQIGRKGVNTLIVSDEPAFEHHGFTEPFKERVRAPIVQAVRAAEEIEETQLAQTFATAIEHLEQLSSPFLMWLHLQGMSGSWDAPREFRERFADEEDPPPPDFVDPPNRELPEDVDPDELLGINHAYAGQVALLDLCLASFLESVAERFEGEECLVIVCSPRGYPLGEHGKIGPSGDGLHEESIHIPLLIRFPGKQHAMVRLHPLVCAEDVHATLINWFGVEPSTGQTDGVNLVDLIQQPDSIVRQGIYSVFRDERSLRTPAWFLRVRDGESPQLFVKPDDRWEVNEVADRRSDVVDEGMQALAALDEKAEQGKLWEFRDFNELLLQPPD